MICVTGRTKKEAFEGLKAELRKLYSTLRVHGNIDDILAKFYNTSGHDHFRSIVELRQQKISEYIMEKVGSCYVFEQCPGTDEPCMYVVDDYFAVELVYLRHYHFSQPVTGR